MEMMIITSPNDGSDGPNDGYISRCIDTNNYLYI